MSEVFKDMIRTVCHRTFRLGAIRGAAIIAVPYEDRMAAGCGDPEIGTLSDRSDIIL
jgi:hypothetical protein